MSQKNFLQFRPVLESLDLRAMPSPLTAATFEPSNAREAAAPAVSEIVVTKSLDCADLNQSLDLTNPDSGEAKGDVKPVADQNGDLWLCRETDNSCECIPW